ncbi:hypothetical protein DRQ09_10455 [candidate division KSB1 bacterium]|nr:MAG: hypothetical protein DRQ09_10455 [candidate division KSB1 bacterium]
MNRKNLTIIGESINYSIPRIKKLFDECVKSGDFSSIQKVAIRQKTQGAKYLDINVGSLSSEIMSETVRKVQEVVDLPLCFDDSDPQKLAAGFEAYNYEKAKEGLPILNSATEFKADTVFELRKRGKCRVILLVSERMEGTSLCYNSTTEEAYRTAKRLFFKALQYGFEPDQIYIDPGIVSIAADMKGLANLTLDLIEKVSSDPELKNVHKVIGITNFIFGLPPKLKMPLQNAFLTMAIQRGLDTVIGNTSVEYKILDDSDEYIQGLKKVLAADGYNRQIALLELYKK